MIVKFKEPISEVWKIVQTLPREGRFLEFSFNDIFEKSSSNNINEIRTEVMKLVDYDYFVRYDSPYLESIPNSLKNFGIHRQRLTFEKEYEVLEISYDRYRLLTDEDAKPYGNDPIIYDPRQFDVIDKDEPSFWVTFMEEDGERSASLPSWKEQYLFDDYHDGVESARQKFWNDLKKYYPKTWIERNIKS